MPVLVLDTEAVGQRIYVVRKFGAGLSGRALGEELGSSDPGLVSKLERGKGVTIERMKQIAQICAGKGVLKNTTPEDIRSFLEGRVDELHVVLDGTFSQMSYFGQDRCGGDVVVLPRWIDPREPDGFVTPEADAA